MKRLWILIAALCCLPMLVSAQDERPEITAENVAHLTEIGQLGSGYLRDVLMWQDENKLAAASTLGFVTFDMSDNSSAQTETTYGPMALFADTNGITAVSVASQQITLMRPGTADVLLQDPYMVDVYQVAMNGGHVASLSQDGTLRIWDAVSGERLQVLHAPMLTGGYSGIPNSVLTYSTDGKLLAAGVGSQVFVWAANDENATVYEVQGGVSAIALNATRLIVGGQNGMLSIYDLAGSSIEPVLTIPAHTGYVRKIIATNDNVISVADDNRLFVGDLYGGEERLSLTADSQVQDMVLDPSGTKLALKTFSNLSVVSVQTGETLFNNSVQQQDFQEIAFNPVNPVMATTAFMPGSLSLWDTQSGMVSTTLQVMTAQGLEFSPDGTRLAALAFLPNVVSSGVVQWDIAGNQIAFFPHPLADNRGDGLSSGMQGVAYSPDGTRLASGRGDGTIFIWDANGMDTQTPLILSGHTGELSDLIFSPDGTRLYSLCYQDGTVRGWDAQSGESLWTIESDVNQNITAIALAPDGNKLVTVANGDHTLRFWDTATGKHTGSITDALPNGAEAFGVVLIYRGDLLAAMSAFSYASPPYTLLRFWDAASNALVGEYRVDVYEHDMAFSADGKTLALGGVDGLIHLLGIDG